MPNDTALWKPPASALVPAKAKTVKAIAPFARQLTDKEQRQIVKSASHGDYEIATSYLWKKTMDALKVQLGALGLPFLSELLDRTDIPDGADPRDVLTDHDALRLADQLGVYGTTDALRLRQALELVNHFTRKRTDADEIDDAGMDSEDFVRIFRSCIQGVLGHESFQGAVEFSKFRGSLEERTFSADDPQIEQLLRSGYFFKKTTVRVLLATVKTAVSAQLENALANFQLILPLLWESLAAPERWMIGRTYAEVHAAGNRPVQSGVAKALLEVHGFDFVPEDIRSRTFIGSAKRVIDAHYAINNFFGEEQPMRQLANLGTSIPMPAVADCMRALLCVFLGNSYGYSFSAEPTARTMLKTLPKERWLYFLNDCISVDDGALDAINEGTATRERWRELCDVYKLTEWANLVRNSNVRKLVLAKSAGEIETIVNVLVTRLRATRR